MASVTSKLDEVRGIVRVEDLTLSVDPVFPPLHSPLSPDGIFLEAVAYVSRHCPSPRHLRWAPVKRKGGLCIMGSRNLARLRARLLMLLSDPLSDPVLLKEKPSQQMNPDQLLVLQGIVT
ncbi:unnamed protein product [Arctogadus glacialis]